jgi:hypothetical protein
MFVMKLDMGLRGFAGVMFGMFVMGVSEMRMMGARFVVAILDEPGRFAMVLGSLFVVLGGVLVMICSVLGVRHGRLLFKDRILRTALNSAILRQTRDGRRQKTLPTLLSRSHEEYAQTRRRHPCRTWSFSEPRPRARGDRGWPRVG